MANRRIAAAVVGTILCLVAAATLVDTSEAASVTARDPRAASLMFDANTPQPIGPCNGTAYVVGELIKFEWQRVPFAFFYDWREGVSNQAQTVDTYIWAQAWNPGFYSWSVASSGIDWDMSERAYCLYSINPS
jgi:hypothetical protein